jgi:hypothetical protein
MPKMPAGGQRASQHIHRKVTQNILDAFEFARDQACPFNRYVVINLRDTANASMATRFRAIRHKYRDWLSYKAKRALMPLIPMYVHTFENPNGGHPHVNWVLHVPDALIPEFERKLDKWIAKVQATEGRPFDRHVQAIDERYKYLAKYILKGTDPVFIEHFFLKQVHCPQGTIWG